MKIEIKDSDIILHGVKCFDLDLTLDCGQAFRWVKEKDGSYSGERAKFFKLKSWFFNK